jgi:hypothetical protein
MRSLAAVHTGKRTTQTSSNKTSSLNFCRSTSKKKGGETHMQEIRLEIEELESRIAPSQAPGLLGYEGQPGNQGGGSGTPNGLKGYEGQPGNQGN